MAKRHMVLNGLLKNSAAAYFAAIEIHNKPDIEYRYETTTVLLMNAWELLLKAYVRKFTKKNILNKDGKSIKYTTALTYTYEGMPKRDRLWFEPIKANLEILETYRNCYSHFYDEELNPIIFSIIAKAAESFVLFMERYFGSGYLSGRNLYILPLGFTLPFEPEGFLGRIAETPKVSREVNDFLEKIVFVTEDLKAKGVNDSIFVGFEVHFGNAKKIENADILAKIDNDSGVPFSKRSVVRPSNDPGAASVSITDDEFFTFYPLEYYDVVNWSRENISDFKKAQKFNEIMRRIQQNPAFAGPKSVNKDKSHPRYYYSNAALTEIKKLWEENIANE